VVKDVDLAEIWIIARFPLLRLEKQDGAVSKVEVDEVLSLCTLLGGHCNCL
jgi:hypothetical protein